MTREEIWKALPKKTSYGKTLEELASEVNCTPERVAFWLGRFGRKVENDGACCFRDKRWRRAASPRIRVYRYTKVVEVERKSSEAQP